MTDEKQTNKQTNQRKKKLFSEENSPGIIGDPSRVPMTKKQLLSVTALLFPTNSKKTTWRLAIDKWFIFPQM